MKLNTLHEYWQVVSSGKKKKRELSFLKHPEDRDRFLKWAYLTEGEIAGPSWHMPDIEEEKMELELQAENLEGEKSKNLEKIVDAMSGGKILTLDQDSKLWKDLENTGSNRPLSVADARRIALSHGKDDHSLDSIENAFRKGKSLPSPIILIRDDGPPYLISGNTRLMLARAYNINPEVLAITY